MQKVIFDSSFLMAVAERPTPWLQDVQAALGGIEPMILDCAKKELERLSSGRGKKARLAGLALELSKEFSLEPSGEAGVDDEIASAALTSKAAVATTDGDLAETLRALGVIVVGLKSGRVAIL